MTVARPPGASTVVKRVIPQAADPPAGTLGRQVGPTPARIIVPNDAPGLTGRKQERKIALRIVQNAEMTLTDVAVPNTDRLVGATSLADTAAVLRMTRAGVAWTASDAPTAATATPSTTPEPDDNSAGPSADSNSFRTFSPGCWATSSPPTDCASDWHNSQDQGLAKDQHSSLVKAVCTMRMRETVGCARALMGGNGILLEHNVGRFVADAEAIYSYEGTREMNTLIVGRSITGIRAFT